VPKVLLIEDEASIRAVLKDILKDQKELKLEVEEAKDGAEGLAKLEHGSIAAGKGKRNYNNFCYDLSPWHN
jgi:CheY-like chemotaxis protein